MHKTLATVVAIASLLTLTGCNTTQPAAQPSTVNHPPSADGPNPTVNPDGTVRRLYINR